MPNNPISVTVLQNHLPAIESALRQRAVAACAATGNAVVAGARARVHKVSRRLHDSIRSTEAVMRNDVVTVVAHADMPYALDEERRVGGRAEGAPFSGSHAFLGPAAEAERGQHTQRVAEAIVAAAGAI